MTDFLRSILQPAKSRPTATTPPPPQPVNQISIPPTAASMASSAVDRQRLIKLEAMDDAKAQRAARRDVVNARRDKRKAMHAQTPSPSPRATMTTAASPLGPPPHPTAPRTMGFDEEDDSRTMATSTSPIAAVDKTKKMKTGKTSSVAVVGGLGQSSPRSPGCSTSVPTTDKKTRLSSTLPPTPGLLFTPEIDAAGEERLRAMEAQLETLDSDSKEAKKKRRLIRNRMSAQLHRERKKAYVGQLEDQLVEKDRELKAMQDKLARMMDETSKLQEQLAQQQKQQQLQQQHHEQPPKESATPVVATPSPTAIKVEDEVVIKEEPTAWTTAPWSLGDSLDTWDLPGLDDPEMVDVDADDLLRDFDYPFAALAEACSADMASKSSLLLPTPEIHAAKKNLAMMAAVMFSVSFCSQSSSVYNVTNGCNFSSMFDANPPRSFSQMSVASRIVACLEKTSWKEFRDVTSWMKAAAASASPKKAPTDETTPASPSSPSGVVHSPSAQSDITDSSGSCESPATDLDECIVHDLDEFVYPLDDWFGDNLGDAPAGTMDPDVMLSEAALSAKLAPTSPRSMTTRLYEKLTRLWREKNQVLLTVLNGKREVMQRSVADLSTIRDGLQSGDRFTRVLDGHPTTTTADGGSVTVSDDASVTFLYPMSAFASDKESSPLHALDCAALTMAPAADPMFLEVSCQLNADPVSAVASTM